MAKTITIIGADKVEVSNTLHKIGKDLIAQGPEDMSVSDGYHTFEELYEHRITLYIALCKQYMKATGFRPWRSQLHSDGSGFDGWFVLGLMDEPGKQITYHLPDSKWEETSFAETLDRAPEFDGHTSNDVLKRLAYI